jgi:hypothetical protein
MAYMMMISIEHKFSILPNAGLNLQFLMPDGKLVAWLFLEDQTVEVSILK